MGKLTNVLFIESPKTCIFTIVKNKEMAGIDDDLMDDINIPNKQEEIKIETPNNKVTVRKIPEKHGNGVEIVYKVINYCIDGAMLLLSFVMMSNYDEAYPLIFCFGLIIWMGYRMLSFKRNETINDILGFFLFVMAVIFYIWAIADDYHEIVGKILIPTVYLGYFCAWGALRRKDKGNDGNDK